MEVEVEMDLKKNIERHQDKSQSRISSYDLVHSEINIITYTNEDRIMTDLERENLKVEEYLSEFQQRGQIKDEKIYEI